jgi:hypothetical protein
VEGLVHNLSVLVICLEAVAVFAFLVVLFGARSNRQISHHKFRQGLGFIILVSIILGMIIWLYVR